MNMLARFRSLGAACLLAVALLIPPAAAQQPAPQQIPLTEDQLGELVVGSMLFILYHELGHAYIDQLQLPVVGPEEDVADEFAIFILAQVAKEGEAFGSRALLAAAESWRLMWLEVEPLMRQEPEKFPFWDEHNLDIKRFYNIVCLLYGSDPASFWPLLGQTGVPVERGRKCEDEYNQKWAAWQKLMEPHVVPEGQAPPPGMRRFKVTYGNADNDVAKRLSALFQAEKTWETLVQPLGDNIIMPNDIDVFVRSCGTVNAWWDSQARSVTICYDMIEFLTALFIKANLQPQQVADQGGGQAPPPVPSTTPGGTPPVTTPGGTMPGGNTVPMGPTPPGPPPFGPQTLPQGQTVPQPPIMQSSPIAMVDQRLVGVWQAQANSAGGAAVTRLSLNQDGTFMQLSYSPTTAPFYIWGNYQVDRSRIKFSVTGWQPQQICNVQGCSLPRIPQQEYAQFQLMGPTTMQLRQALFYRVQ
jgi:hypothetical protein